MAESVDAAEHLARMHVYRYDYGCPMRRYMRIYGISTQTMLLDEIEWTVVMSEPHVDLNRVDFEVESGEGYFS